MASAGRRQSSPASGRAAATGPGEWLGVPMFFSSIEPDDARGPSQPRLAIEVDETVTGQPAEGDATPLSGNGPAAIYE